MSYRGADWRGGGGPNFYRGDGGGGRGGRGGGVGGDMSRGDGDRGRGGRGGGGDVSRGDGGRGGGARGGGFSRGVRGARGGSWRGDSTSEAPEVFHGPVGINAVLNLQVTEAEDDFVKSSEQIGKLSALSLKNAFPRRPGYGTQGRSIVVWANYLEVSPTPNLKLFRYDVKITPLKNAREPSRIKKRQIFFLILNQLSAPGLMTDFKTMLISPARLDGVPMDFPIAYMDEGEDEPSTNSPTYRIEIPEPAEIPVSQLVDSLNSSDASALPFGERDTVIQALNVVMGYYPQARADIVTIGQNRHFTTNRDFADIKVLQGGMEALRGFFKSIRVGTSRILLNVNVSHAVFYAPVRLDDLMIKFGTANKISLIKYLKWLRVRRLHIQARKNKNGKDIPSVKTICDFATIDDGSADANRPSVTQYAAGPKGVEFFLNATTAGISGRYVSVWAYFKNNYPNIEMNPRLPIVNVGSRARPSYLPAEALEVLPGQPIGRKLAPQATREMIAFAVRTPKANAESIVGNGRAILGLDPQANSGLQRFGLSIGASLITVPARVLEPPPIKYGLKTIRARSGAWNMNETKLSIGKNISQWTYLWIKSNRVAPQAFRDGNHLKLTVDAFMGLMEKMGVVMAPCIQSRQPPVLDLKDGQDSENDTLIENLLDRMIDSGPEKPRFLLVILPYNDSAIYRKIKTMGDTKAGVHTVCVVEAKFAKETRREQYFANVALKFNLKAGGINQTIDADKLGIISEGKTMVVGIDVTHPSPGSTSTAPSIAGIVASIGKDLGQWPADLRIQEPRKEMVTDLTDLFKSRLVLWREQNKVLPDNILVYRDGVSEGQYQTVLDEELPCIRAACKDLYPATETKKGNPKVSIIIVGKRHHTRFYPTKAQDADRSSNCLNGTVVDRGVTDVRMWDFFLQAHACLQGTARPAHYVVILDEIFRGNKPKNQNHKHAADTLEDLTHNMCHLFGRATKAVSICPPAYYADLLCERARCYLGRLYEPPPASGSTAPSTTGSEAGPVQTDVTVHPDLRDSMFYI